jgi:hypothetical protein
MLKRLRTSSAGNASVEVVPILLLFALLFNYTIGFFGVIHSGILNSIAARNYTFETFRNRPNLTYLRDIDQGRGFEVEIGSRYTKHNYRFHGIVSETNGGVQTWIATQRTIRFTDTNQLEQRLGNQGDHEILIRNIQSAGKVSDTFTGKTADEGKAGVNPVWIQSLYGICLNSTCRPP